MSLPPAASHAPVSTAAISADTRLRGGWLALVWVGWSILALLSLMNVVTSIPTYLAATRSLCRPDACVAGQPTPATTHTLQQLGLSVGTYAGLSVGLVLSPDSSIAGLPRSFSGAGRMTGWRCSRPTC